MKERLEILVVDSNEVDCMALCLALTKAAVNMEVCAVSDYDHALSALQNTNFDCIFLDYCLINEDKFIFIDKLGSSKIKVPVVILIDETDEQIAIEFLSAGAIDYLVKEHIKSENLPRIIRNAIRLYQVEIKANLAYQRLQEIEEKLVCQQQELEKQEQQIQLQNLKVLLGEQVKSEFLSTISHELRTPMNAIIGFAQILLRTKFGQLNHQQTDMVERILNNGKNLLILLNEVLDFSKLDSGKLELKPEIVDFSKIVKASVSEISSLAAAKNLSLLVEMNLENSLIFNDAGRVHQILINLLSNAVKFTEYGSIRLEVKEISTNELAITIEDTGIGISAEDSVHIFEPFRQIDQGINRKYSGSGLGLAIIDSLLKMMGGKIFLESQLGVGSIFKIELPRQIKLAANNQENYILNMNDNDGIYYSYQHLPGVKSQCHKVSLGSPHRRW